MESVPPALSDQGTSADPGVLTHAEPEVIPITEEEDSNHYGEEDDYGGEVDVIVDRN